MKISERIQASRRSDTEIAGVVGVNPSVVWHWRKGRTSPHIRFVAALAKAIGCAPVDLIPPTPPQDGAT